MRRGTPLELLALLLTLGGCSSTWTLEGEWAAGDLHVHTTVGSNDTHESSSIDAVVAAGRQEGLRWVVVTDHSNSAGSMDCPDVEDCPNQGPEFPAAAEATEAGGDDFLVVVGSELSPVETLEDVGGPVGHVGCLPPGGGFDFEGAFIDRPPGALLGSEVLEQCEDVGGFSVVNHPFAPVSWIRWDWSSDAFDALEVWNGGLGWDDSDERALWAWECSVAQGRPTVPLAASDSHHATVARGADPLSPAVGSPQTSILLAPGEALGWSGLAAGLERGAVVLHESDSFVALRSISAQRSEEEWRLVGTIPSPAVLQVRQVPRDGSCDPAEQQVPLHQVLWEEEVVGDFDVRAQVLAILDGDDSVGRYLFLEQKERAPFSGGVAMTGLLPLAR